MTIRLKNFFRDKCPELLIPKGITLTKEEQQLKNVIDVCKAIGFEESLEEMIKNLKPETKNMVNKDAV